METKPTKSLKRGIKPLQLGHVELQCSCGVTDKDKRDFYLSFLEKEVANGKVKNETQLLIKYLKAKFPEFANYTKKVKLSAEEVEEILTMNANKHSIKDIATKMEASTHTVRNVIRRAELGIPSYSFNESEYLPRAITIISNMYVARIGTIQQMADEIGVSVRCINMWKSGQTFPKSENIKKINQLFGTNLTYPGSNIKPLFKI